MAKGARMSQTPGPLMEIDLVDPADRVVGTTLRKDVFRQNDGFRVVHIFIFDRRRRLLLQQLGASRDRNPLHWGSSVAGYLFTGEQYEEAAERRLYQELQIQGPKLRLVGRTAMLDEGVVKFITLFETTWSKETRRDATHIARLRWLSLSSIDRAIRERSIRFTPTFLEVYPFYRISRSDG
jgi:isopentenyldiphosphate isomerase